MMERVSDGPIVIVVVVVHARLPAICVFCRALRVHQSASGASPSIRLRGDAVACRISVLGLVFYSLRPGPVRPDPTVGLVSPLARSCPPRAQPALGGSGCDCDGSHTVKSLSRPSHPIPSSPSPWWSWWFAAFLTLSPCSLVLVPISIPIHLPPPFGPSFRTAGRPHSHSHSPVPVLILPPPTLMGSWVSLPRLFPPRAHLTSSPVPLVLFALVVWVFSGLVRSGLALHCPSCLAVPSPRLGLACPGPALPCSGVVWL